MFSGQLWSQSNVLKKMTLLLEIIVPIPMSNYRTARHISRRKISYINKSGYQGYEATQALGWQILMDRYQSSNSTGMISHQDDYDFDFSLNRELEQVMRNYQSASENVSEPETRRPISGIRRPPSPPAEDPFEDLEDVPTPLSQERRDNFPIIKFREGSILNGRKCSICQMDFETEEEILILSCLDCFHPACINRWFDKKNRCPNCNQNLS